MSTKNYNFKMDKDEKRWYQAMLAYLYQKLGK